MDNNWIETCSGIQFHFMDPQPEEIQVKDIAHALGNSCRFVGQRRKFYSVAEHSWHIARMLEGTPLRVQLAGLMHDASEAYITDMASPVKQHLKDYKALEDVVQGAIFRKYGLEYPMHPAIKWADLSMLSNEAHHLLTSKGNTWEMWRNIKRPAVIDAYRPVGMSPETASELFLDKFYELRMAIRREEQQEQNEHVGIDG